MTKTLSTLPPGSDCLSPDALSVKKALSLNYELQSNTTLIQLNDSCAQIQPLSTNDALYWHKAFGHIGIRTIQNMIKSHMGLNLSHYLSSMKINCEDWLATKCPRN
ncbi:hypothetical protein BY996DRAFT_6609589 [Phakopsora pachyrhizi]|nr:hypothetical protein BY996DRAFT_6609589 [Phakopsora pachyrhizi]